MTIKKRIWQDSEANIDFLNFGYMVDLVADLATNRDISPSTIGVYGDWGSGKSSLMRMVQKKIESSDDNKIICVRFNGWLFEGYEDAKTSLCGVILDEIRNSSKVVPSIKAKATKLLKKIDVNKLLGKGIKLAVDKILTGGIGTITELTIKSIINSLRLSAGDITANQVEELLNKYKTEENTREEIKNFQCEFAKLINDSKIDQLVVFIDELDRCTPDTILEVFEAMRLFLFAKGTSFIIGADERLIQYSIKTKYKEIPENNLDIGKEYLEKVIQYPITIPQLTPSEVNQYIFCLLIQPPSTEKDVFNEILSIVHGLQPDQSLTVGLIEEKNKSLVDECKEEIALSNQISSVLANSISGNPRQCKRFLNTLFLREQLAESRGIELDINIQAKLLLAEYFKEDLFKLVTDPGNSDYFKEFESGATIEAGNPFAKLAENKWVMSWIQTEPKLSGKSFEKYLYFATKASRYRQSKIDFLSPTARKCYDYLIDGTQTHRQEALKMITGISDGERSIIWNSIFDTLTASSSVKPELLKSFVDVSLAIDCPSAAVKRLQEIPASKYPSESMAQLSVFMQRLTPQEKNQLKAYLENNPALKGAIQRLGELEDKLLKK